MPTTHGKVCSVKALFERGAVPSKGWRAYKVIKVYVAGDKETCGTYALSPSAAENSTPAPPPPVKNLMSFPTPEDCKLSKFIPRSTPRTYKTHLM